ncbi:type VI secretion system-associated protein TagF [Rhodobacteraceae bacterium 2376]|uniref:Type VI secretion system-associated protein TagF n=1 Tax=Rhabdonatronobacter sediminivivens TaxID=2743469 RepID=A0A7Z0I0K5_9RHOB|nr:type VI secretion system-associated protein TagF [Rhabdonatronobacter sediminivivens]NYS25645.1 type VI secretion system-associated protein TagF [Rhabdonatronobacter sediminivivens]
MAGAFGAFGKLPALGDFLRAGTPPGFVEPWDAWVQRAMMTARNTLGVRWHDCYFSAPIWRFTLAHGLAGRLPVMGILMASVDRVGRHFPLTLMAPLPQGTSSVQAHLSAEGTFVRLENLALEALETCQERALFLQRLSALPGFSQQHSARFSQAGRTLTLVGAEGNPATGLAAGLIEPRYRQPCIWSTLLTEGTRVMVTEGLPDARQSVGLFDLSAPVWTGSDEGT